MNSEKNFIKALKGNNEIDVDSAFSYFYNKYCRLAYICILSIIKDKRDAEELTDDTFIKLFNNRHYISEKENIKYYIVTIAKNLAIDFLRKKHVDIVLNEEYVFNCVGSNNVDELTLLKDKLSPYLSISDCNIVIEHIVFASTFKEIAVYYKLPLSTVKTRYFRAIKKLQNEMRDSYEKS